MSTPRVGVLAVQGDVPEHLRALEAVGARAGTVRHRADLGTIDALVLPGGESTAIATLLVHRQMMQPIREAIAAGMPVYGSCAGMILLADEVLDGVAGQCGIGGLDITVRRNAFGSQVHSFETDLLAPEVLGGHSDAEPLRAVFIRAPWVERAGPEVQVLARVGAGPASGRIVAVRQGVLMATAFHPEIGSDLRIHRAFVDMVATHLG
ncbi:pyridoxal 5'-phosphate synthase glutaminase subunit PdxT [Pseudactinotalea sp. Z1739]|uniref:pyridoxal 5'-phosphate synthase glutaminase subunit PdxT n=1 Tax=Pseudactinotalea sp. Z1739 TaxID=3413028 RepID=UPI003C7BDD8F